MATNHSTKSTRTSRTDKPLIVGYRPQGGETNTPQITLSGKWLSEAGFEPGQHYTVKISDGCLVVMAMNSREEELLAELETTRRKLTEMKRSIGDVFKAA
ncbi:SymE family type I addiction module toxin [Atlantibacter sp.]|uniref:SymE family type I addiction module toxin n=1 Tax=Atlantibacter sp. TaxID=1903473 RepID=UPI0028AD48BD|nr:SymE family type I addiction module toxin [Atlantibacter sp.]